MVPTRNLFLTIGNCVKPLSTMPSTLTLNYCVELHYVVVHGKYMYMREYSQTRQSQKFLLPDYLTQLRLL